MPSRTTLTLLVAVLLVGGYVLMVERDADRRDRRQDRARRAIYFDPARVTGLRLSSADVQASLENKAGWWLVSPMKARADAGAVARVLDTLSTLKRSEVISGREQREQNLSPADFGFDQPRARITLREKDQDLTLLVGRDTPIGGNLFLKLETEASIFVASTNLLADLPASPDALRERKIFLGMPSDVARMDVRRAEGLLQLARADSGIWRIQKPVVGRAAYASVQALLDGLFEIQVQDFVADSIAAASLYGLDEPAAQVILASARGQGEQILRLGRMVDGNTNQVYAAVEGAESVVTLDVGKLNLLAIRAADLRDRRLITLSAYDIGYIRSTEGEQNMSLVREEDGKWSMLEPRRFKASDERMQAVVSEWTGLRIDAFVDEPGTNLALWGLSPPARRITLARRPPASSNLLATAAADESVTILVAREAPSEADGLLVKVENEDTLYRVSRTALTTLPMQPLFYRDPVVLQIALDEVRGITRRVAGTEQRVEKATSTNLLWRAAAGITVDEAAVSNVLDRLRVVRTADYVVEDPETLDAWGLAEPQATLTVNLSTAGAISKTLIFGDDAGPDTVFAMVQGQELVFTLRRTERDLLLTPLYRDNPSTPPRVESTSQPSADTEADY